MVQIRTYAERILFSETLDEKLKTPLRLDDSDPGSGIVVPTAPSRPVGLVCVRQEQATKIPSRN